MENKKCFICNETKPLDEFYKHPAMGDGHLNKCKSCTKRQSNERYEALTENESFVESERIRSRERYHRLNYRESQCKRNKEKTYKNAKYKQLHRKLKLSKNVNAHHWNYNFTNDVIILTFKEHKKAHKHLILDEVNLFFKTKEGELLDTKKKHIEFLESKGIAFNLD